MTSMPALCEHFANSIEAALNDCHTGKAEERWSHICDAIYNSAMDTFGKRERGRTQIGLKKGLLNYS